MSRPKNIRKLSLPLLFKGYKPFGHYTNEKEPVFLLSEEFESIRLCDYELLSQLQAAALIGVSRPTFTRIYESARRKVAIAFSEVREIIVEHGNAYYDQHWLCCNKCQVHFNNVSKKSKYCPLCSRSFPQLTKANKSLSSKKTEKNGGAKFFIIAAKTDSSNSMLSENFARAPFFALIRSGYKRINFLENTFLKTEENTGKKVSELLSRENIDYVITQRIGLQMIQMLKKKNIAVIISDNHTRILSDFQNIINISQRK